jgi:hypothetical protein
MRIELHIDRLVLDPAVVSRREAGAVRESLETELSRLLAASPPGTWQAARRRRATGPDVPAGRRGGLGPGLARSVYEGLRAPRDESVRGSTGKGRPG